MKVVYKSGSQIDIDFVSEYLHSNGLETLVKHTGAGSYMNITTGYSVSEIQLLVEDKDVEKAVELIKEIEPQKNEVEGKRRKGIDSKRIFAWIMLAVVVLTIFVYLFNQ